MSRRQRVIFGVLGCAVLLPIGAAYAWWMRFAEGRP